MTVYNLVLFVEDMDNKEKSSYQLSLSSWNQVIKCTSIGLKGDHLLSSVQEK